MQVTSKVRVEYVWNTCGIRVECVHLLVATVVARQLRYTQWWLRWLLCWLRLWLLRWLLRWSVRVAACCCVLLSANYSWWNFFLKFFFHFFRCSRLLFFLEQLSAWRYECSLHMANRCFCDVLPWQDWDTGRSSASSRPLYTPPFCLFSPI